MKNIPILSKQDYRIQFINSVEKFVKSLRWRAHFFPNPTENSKSKENFGFNSTKPAPSVAELKDFEDELIDLTESIKFNDNQRNHFLSNLRNDKRMIESESRIYIAADKTSNYYKVGKEKYQEL